MIFNLLLQAAAGSGTAFLITSNGAVSYEQIKAEACSIAVNLRNATPGRIAVSLSDSRQLISAFFGASAAGREMAVISSSYSITERDEAVVAAGANSVIDDTNFTALLGRARERAAELIPEEDTAQIIILTSGTTGAPKAVVHNWRDLASQIKRMPAAERRWILLYPLNHFAGIQVFLHALMHREPIVLPKSRSPIDVFSAMKQFAVTHASGTPTFWRMFLAQIADTDCKDLALAHITLGGEIASEEILTGLTRAFPRATISHVYATTELGSCFSVNDGKPGFPLHLLDAPSRPVKLKIIGDELYVHSPYKMLGYAGSEDANCTDEWVATGDLVRVVNDRVHFLGRKSEVINVGGAKVHPLEVETILLQVQGVEAVRAYGQNNPVTGALVAADVALKHGFQADRVRQQIQEICSERLDRHKRPRLIRFLDQLPVANEKLVRRVEP